MYAKKNIIKVIPTELMEDLFYLYSREMNRINKTVKRSEWYQLPPKVLKYIEVYCRTFMDINKFEAMQVCESREWPYIRVSTKDNRKVPIEGRIKMTDDLYDKDNVPNVAWISLTDDKRTARVPCVPLLFIKKWRKNCREITNPEHENELDIIIDKAKRNPNKWNKIECGRYRSVRLTNFPCEMNLD